MKTKENKKKKTMVLLLCLFLLVMGGITIFFWKQQDAKDKKLKQETQDMEQIAIKKQRYQPQVKTITATDLYRKTNTDYEKVGTIAKDVLLYLNKTDDFNISKDTEYFPLKNCDYYVSYQDITESVVQVLPNQDRWKRYIVFNENVKTTATTNLYQEDTLVLQLTEGIDFPIVKKTKDNYYVSFNDQLLSVKKEEATIYENKNTEEKAATAVATIAYHFFYDKTKDACNEIICHDVSQIKAHFNYLKENNFLTLQMQEVEAFIDGEIRIPENSVIITIDDGARAENAIPLLEEYQLNATLFLITSWYDPAKFQSDYLEIHSHGHDLHNPGMCEGGQGGPIKCMEKSKLLKDLKTTREILGGSTVFCYPFYEYNNYAIATLKEAGFTMAFAGGARKIKIGANKMILPRYTLISTTTVNDLAKILAN